MGTPGDHAGRGGNRYSTGSRPVSLWKAWR
jgi:hypothetical protein